jgi:aldose sugar dehydrogenase
MRILLAAVSLLALTAAVGAQTPPPPSAPPPTVNDVAALPAATGWRAETVVGGLAHPWAIAWLPNGDALITERPGRLRLLRADGQLDPTPIPGLPAVLALRQGGLMDVSLHPDFAANRTLYLTLSAGTAEANATRLVKALFDGQKLTDVEEIFRASPDKAAGFHFGARIVWLPDGTMLLSIGDGGRTRDQAQELGAHFGKVLRLDANGKAMSGNPFNARVDALPEIYSFGHRNIQGMVYDPVRQAVFASEHGAQGGDEVNRLEAGANYGWPAFTFAVEYGPTRTPISPNQTGPSIKAPLAVWSPGIGPSGLALYSGDRFPAWKGDLFAGGLVGKVIVRLDLDAGGAVIGQQRLAMDARIRDVRQGPDGFLYALTDEENGRLIRIRPAS